MDWKRDHVRHSVAELKHSLEYFAHAKILHESIFSTRPLLPSWPNSCPRKVYRASLLVLSSYRSVCSKQHCVLKLKAKHSGLSFCSLTRLLGERDQNLSPSAERTLRLTTLWTMSSHLYMVKVLHGCVLDVGGRLELPSKTKGSSRRRRAGVVKLIRFCTPFSVTRMVVCHFLPLVDQVWSL